jgi:signal transduction histidine kinase
MAHARLHSNIWRSTVFRRTLSVVLLLAGVAASVIGFVGWNANAILTRAAEQAIEADAAELRTVLRARGIEGLTRAIDERSRIGGPGVYYLTDISGVRRAGTLDQPPVWQSTGGRGLFHYVEQASGAERTAAGLLIEIDGEPRLVIGRDIEEQRALLRSIYRSVGLGAGVLALIGLAGGVLLSRHILSRIEAMSLASGSIMAGNLSERIPTDSSGDELDRLATQLNQMLVRIEQLMAGLREVSDNIAHDLKTPLNRLRNRAEAALGDNRGGEVWRQGLERVIDEADELIKTFNSLLLIARLEAGGSSDRFEPLDLAVLASDVAELYEPVAEEAGFELRCETAGPIPIRADRQLIGQAMANLIENALKYAASSPGRRHVHITAARSGDWARLVVADRGPGIAPENRERALKRFVRLEQSRSLPGTGLGLSLVAAVARLHSGRVTLDDNAPGLRVVVDLPLAREPSGMSNSRIAATAEQENARG